MQRKVGSLEEKVEEIYDYQIDPDEVEKKLMDLEDRSRGNNNLQIDGVAEELGQLRAKIEIDFYGQTSVRK